MARAGFVAPGVDVVVEAAEVPEVRVESAAGRCLGLGGRAAVPVVIPQATRARSRRHAAGARAGARQIHRAPRRARSGRSGFVHHFPTAWVAAAKVGGGQMDAAAAKVERGVGGGVGYLGRGRCGAGPYPADRSLSAMVVMPSGIPAPGTDNARLCMFTCCGNRLAVGETVILPFPPSTFSRCFNIDEKRTSVK